MGIRPGCAVAIACALAGCLDARSQECRSGRICPPGSTCDDALDRCLTEDQVLACAGQDEGGSCSFGGADGVCMSGACIGDACGDGRVSGSEACEPGVALTVDCTRFGFYFPDGLLCGDDCKLDDSVCDGFCGDGRRDGPEVCEGDDLGAATCQTFGFYQPGGLACSPASCTYDVAGCSGRCGDDMIDVTEGEACEGDVAPPGTCVDYGFDAGSLRCAGCRPGFAACGDIGWRSEDVPVVGPVTDIWAASAAQVFAVDGYFILRRSGGSWTVEHTGSVFHGVYGWGDDVIAFSNGGVVRRPTAPPFDWHDTGAPGAGAVDLWDAWGGSFDDLWVVGGQILHHTAAGWEQIALPDGAQTLQAVHGATPGEVWAVGLGGTVLHWKGVAWSYEAPTTADLYAVWASGPDDVWAAGDALLHYNGLGWTELARPPSTVRDLWAAGRDDVTAVGENGLVMQWDGRAWWSEQQAGGRISCLWGVDDELFICGGDQGQVGIRAATTWIDQGLDPEDAAAPFASVFGVATDAVLVSGDPDRLWRYGGDTWSSQPAPARMVSMWGPDLGDLWAVSDAGALWHSDGFDWTAVPEAGSTLRRLWGSGPDDVWAFGDESYHWDGAVWTLDPDVGGGAEDVWGSGPDDIWLTGGIHRLRHFDGDAWTASLVGPFDVYTGVWGSAPDDVWAINQTGVVMHFDGVAWTQVADLIATVSTALWGTAPDDIFALASGGRTFHFDGTAWAPVRSQGPDTISEAWGDRGSFYLIGDGVQRVARHRRWSCRAAETACGDTIDDDCDGAIDGADADCDGAIVLDELHGGAEPFVELRNTLGVAANLSGLMVEWSLGCSAGRFPFTADAIAPPGGVVRAIGDRTPGQRERWTDLCDAPDASGWAALCVGACDWVQCSNVVDFVARRVGVTSPHLPDCATMTPAPIDVAGVTEADSVTRIGYGTVGPDADAADWAIAPVTRD